MSKFYHLLLLFSFFCASAQPQARNMKAEITWMKNSLLRAHVQPRAIDDQYSADLFDQIIESLDPDRIFFTGQDLAAIQSYRRSIDDEINTGNIRFLGVLKEQYRRGLQRSEKLINAMLEAPIDWGKKEMYEPEGGRAENDQILSDHCRRWLKHLVLERLSELMQRDTVFTAGFFQKHVNEAISYTRVSVLRPVIRLLNDPAAYDNEISDTFLRAMASVFDPHSTFLSRRAFDDFVASLSTEDYYFGFTLGEDARGNVIISALAPGSAAWKSGALHVSDMLVAIRWPGEDRVDVQGMNIDDVNELLDRSKDEVLEMTIRTVDGHEKQVMLRKEKLESEGNIVQSFILEGEIKAGYIYLPDFYTRWDDEQEGGRCANDVAKEIIRLKREGIEGLILDLRFNGGGSLHEARAMAGIFIDEGPLAMVRAQDTKTVSLKDLNRGTVYDGHLVIMVNGGSASASEVLAASIQDYHRGLIVGSRTYGKATGQNVFPLEGLSTAPGKKPQSKTGYVKVTTQRLYRVTGKSAQGRGVMPDVVIPDALRALDLSEARQAFALQPDSIPANTYYKPLIPLTTKELQERSRERISKNPAFQQLQKTIDWLDELTEQSARPRLLTWESYSAAAMSDLQHVGKIDVESREKIYDVVNPAAKRERLAVDEYAREINDRWREILSTELYVQESYQVLRDHILLTKNPSR